MNLGGKTPTALKKGNAEMVPPGNVLTHYTMLAV